MIIILFFFFFFFLFCFNPRFFLLVFCLWGWAEKGWWSDSVFMFSDINKCCIHVMRTSKTYMQLAAILLECRIVILYFHSGPENKGHNWLAHWKKNTKNRNNKNELNRIWCVDGCVAMGRRGAKDWRHNNCKINIYKKKKRSDEWFPSVTFNRKEESSSIYALLDVVAAFSLARRHKVPLKKKKKKKNQWPTTIVMCLFVRKSAGQKRSATDKIGVWTSKWKRGRALIGKTQPFIVNAEKS